MNMRLWGINGWTLKVYRQKWSPSKMMEAIQAQRKAKQQEFMEEQ